MATKPAICHPLDRIVHMKYYYFFFWTWWIWTLAIGLPIFAVLTWCRWKQAQNALQWRIILCVIFACVIAPTVAEEDDWGNPRLIDISPAIATLLILPCKAAIAVFRGQFSFHDLFDCLWVIFCDSIFPIFVVSIVLSGYWSAIIRKKKLID
jgi:hypothetical protein